MYEKGNRDARVSSIGHEATAGSNSRTTRLLTCELDRPSGSLETGIQQFGTTGNAGQSVQTRDLSPVDVVSNRDTRKPAQLTESSFLQSVRFCSGTVTPEYDSSV